MEIARAIIDLLTAVLSLLTLLSPTERKRRNVLMKFCGQYQGYHLATTRSGNVIASSLLIEKSFGKRLKISLTSFGYRYRGEMTINDTNVYLSLDGIGHKEKILMIFNEPLTENFDVLQGIYSAVTETRLPACGKFWIQKVDTLPRCDRIPKEQADPKVMAFLSSEDNPFIVSKLDRPIYDEIN